MSLKSPKAPGPWWIDCGVSAIVIRDCYGVAVCSIPCKADVHARLEENALARAFVSLPEFIVLLNVLVCCRRKDETGSLESFETSPCTADEMSVVQGDVHELLSLTVKTGVILGELA